MAKQNHYKFTDLNAEKLWQLRSEVTLNWDSVNSNEPERFFSNSFGFDAGAVQNFFKGYLIDLATIAFEEYGVRMPMDFAQHNFDNEDNLFDYYWGLGAEDMFSGDFCPDWDSEDEMEYERFWNGIEKGEE